MSSAVVSGIVLLHVRTALAICLRHYLPISCRVAYTATTTYIRSPVSLVHIVYDYSCRTEMQVATILFIQTLVEKITLHHW
jgi:hypothetical protein